MADLAILTTAIVTGVISLSSGLVRTERVDQNFFVVPALRALKAVKKSINNSSTDKCPECDDEYVEPYFRISLRRLQLVVFLTPILFALLTQATLLALIHGNETAALSFIIWASLPGILIGRYVLELSDVFNWWKKPSVRNALALFSISIGATTSINPYFADIVGWILTPQEISIGFFRFRTEYAFVFFIGLAIAFLLARYVLNQLKPSFKTRITRRLHDTGAGLTLEQWMSYLDPYNEWPLARLKEETQHSLRELVYQNVLEVKLANRSSEAIYTSPS